jgi:hypothetical protein
MGFKLSRLDTRTKADAGVEMAVRDLETGEPSDFVLLVAGADSKQAQEAQDRVSRRYMLAADSTAKPTVAQLREDGLDLLVAVTLGWRGLEDEAGEPIPFSPAKAKELYSQCPELADQVRRFTRDRANFLLG